MFKSVQLDPPNWYDRETKDTWYTRFEEGTVSLDEQKRIRIALYAANDEFDYKTKNEHNIRGKFRRAWAAGAGWAIGGPALKKK